MFDPYERLPKVPSFEVTSTDFAEGETLRNPQVSGILGSGGEDVSPQLSWSGAPEGTKSYAVTCLDPDAPTGSGFWHWAILNIPTSVTELATGAEAPEGSVALKNDGGTVGYIGAAPPAGHGPHHYHFVVHALDVERLDLDETATPAVLGFNMFFHTLGRARTIAMYEELGDSK
jgi:Raf kinase inhibitor-like YbhB/YbcL family protein